MKLIVLSDLRGAHAAMYILLKETVADAYLVCGDLIDGPFYSAESNAGYGTRQSHEDDPGLSERARRSAAQKYRVLENIFSTKPYAAILAVPGPGDTDIRGSAVGARCLFGETRPAGSLIIAGIASDRAATIDDIAPRGPHALAVHESREPEVRALSVPLLIIYGGSALPSCIGREGGTVVLRPAAFSPVLRGEEMLYDGGLFYECSFHDGALSRIILKKLVGERVIDIAEYAVHAGGSVEQRVVDGERFRAMKEARAADLPMDDAARAPEIRLFRDIRNFLRIHQTQETEKRVELLERAIESLGDDRGRVALDLVGSANVGLSGKSSDVDMVLYLRAGCETDEDLFRKKFDAAEEGLRAALGEGFEFEVIDRIDLDRVEKSLREKDPDCDAAQLFVTYRSACRPVNYRALSPLEDLLNLDLPYRRELEERMRSYLRMFARTSDNSKSFEKYLNRLRTSGIAIPDYLEKKINLMLQKKRG